MIYAPICVITLNRYSHFIRLIESLKRCTDADKTELFISVDYPPSEKYVSGWKKIKEYLSDEIKEFKSVHVFYQDHNLGAGENSIFIREKALERFDRWITAEDDNEFFPAALQFFNQCFEYFEHDDKVMSISAWSGPSIYIPDTKNNVFMISDHSAWGHGRWERKEANLHVDYDYIHENLKKKDISIKLRKHSELTFHRAVRILFHDYDEIFFNDGVTLKRCDVVRTIYNIIEDTYQVRPCLRLVQNWGMDGSGLNCGNIQSEFDKDLGPVNSSPEFHLLYTPENACDVTKEYAQYSKKISWFKVHKMVFCLFLYRHWGDAPAKAFYFANKKITGWMDRQRKLCIGILKKMLPKTIIDVLKKMR